jgi:hypothetical protein
MAVDLAVVCAAERHSVGRVVRALDVVVCEQRLRDGAAVSVVEDALAAETGRLEHLAAEACLGGAVAVR